VATNGTRADGLIATAIFRRRQAAMVSIGVHLGPEASAMWRCRVRTGFDLRETAGSTELLRQLVVADRADVFARWEARTPGIRIAVRH